ncbi:aldehyde dehydrogenase family protein [Sphingobium phenoxybenzoativorans]|uniref:Aldehyde dehydrogenase family protein n=1 Tax=Sphingobium phenoxybenzoativorans TaxID=1592790 RepID=A0A975K8X8_9SPHN|nr:aldehyde dehydrogenase family protein [Sphingobium phenoxybenzoativorans]QUT06990.1 aldehyde dehydrogenase family protein [Sphingobium phenoxybenzoativorans]
MSAIERFDRLFIGGEWVAPHAGTHIATIDPSTEDVWAEVASADETDVENAVAAARAAMRGPWGRTAPTQRGALIAKFADLVRRDAARLAEIESRDNGKPLRDTLGEVQRAADWLTFFAGAADKVNGDQIPYRPDALAYTRLEPVGVVVAILPWNSPISLASWKLGPGLAAGNAMILKPAEQTPASMVALAALALEAGFPAGVINVLPGDGAVGAALSAHPGVAKVSFTGSHDTAIRIMQSGSVNLKRCSFECGGKSPFIVFEDADFDKALSVATHSAFRSTGQSCSMASRIFVQRPLYERFAAELAGRAARIRPGAPFDPRTHIGPQTSAEQRDKTESYIALGRESGARVLAGGGRPAGLPKGYFVEPTVFADADNRSRIAQEEIFGPVTSVMPFDTEDEAIALANDTRYGLVGGLWTKDVSRAHRVAAQIESGLVSVNTFRPVHFMLPYGGYKMSGIGRENGFDAIRAFTETKTVVVDLSDAIPPDPFAD